MNDDDSDILARLEALHDLMRQMIVRVDKLIAVQQTRAAEASVHDVLRSLPQDEFDRLPVLTRQELNDALAAGLATTIARRKPRGRW